MADATIKTRFVGAVVDVRFAVFALKPIGTFTLIVVDQIVALRSILARILLTFVDINFAIFALETRQAVAFEVIYQIHATCKDDMR